MHRPALNSPKREGAVWGAFVTLCEGCHYLVTKGEIILRRGKPSEGFKAEIFMTRVRGKLIECFIFGRGTSGYFDLKKLDGTKVPASAKASEITLIESAKTILTERMRIPLHACLAA